MTTEDEKKDLEKLFAQTLATFGVCEFNIIQLHEDKARLFEQLKEMKDKLDKARLENTK